MRLTGELAPGDVDIEISGLEPRSDDESYLSKESKNPQRLPIVRAPTAMASPFQPKPRECDCGVGDWPNGGVVGI